MKKEIIFFVIILVFTLTTNLKAGFVRQWNLADSIPYRYGIWYQTIQCADDSNCIAFGNLGNTQPWNRVTTDGGKSWFSSYIDTMTKGNNPVRIFELSYPDTSLCIAVGDSNYVLRSTDKGKSWSKSKLPGDVYNATITNFRVKMFNRDYGVISTPPTQFYTFNGGVDWIKLNVTIPDTLHPICHCDISLPIIETVYFLLVDKNRTYLFKSYNNGTTWTKGGDVPKHVYRIFFINEKEGWACGQEQKYPLANIFRNIILHTTDAGESWEIQLDSLPEDKLGLINIKFADSLNGVAIGEFYNMWITTDGGKHWVLDQSYTHDDYFYDVFMLKNHDILGATSMTGLIFKSSSITGIESNKSNSDNFTISPNPANDYITITLPSDAHTLKGVVEGVRLYDVFGQDVSDGLHLEGGAHLSPNVRIDVSALPAGVYFVRVGDKVSKFVKL